MTDFINHTVNWVHGEMLESAVFGSFGLLLLLASTIFWKFGDTENARAIIIPFLVVGSLLSTAGVAGVYNNSQRISAFTAIYQQSATTFVEREKVRVEGFMQWYVYTFVIASVLIMLGLIGFLFINKPSIKAAGLATIVLGVSALFIDYFSKERAQIYLHHIDQALAQAH